MVDLTGPQRQELVDALAKAFPSFHALQKMVSFGLDEGLEEIAGTGSLDDVAFRLVGWAEAHGRLGDLITAAITANPGSPRLQTFQAGSWTATALAPTEAAPSGEPTGDDTHASVRTAPSRDDPDSAKSRRDTREPRPARPAPSPRAAHNAVDDPHRSPKPESRVSRRGISALLAALAGAGGVLAFLKRHQDEEASQRSGQLTTQSTQEPRTAEAPGAALQSLTIPFINVPHPDFLDRLIPDVDTSAWRDLGQRLVQGIVLHRLERSLQDQDAWLRNPDGGGQVQLFDYGVDHESGAIWRWNDPFGDEHPGVSANRAGLANGPGSVQSGNGLAFLEDNCDDYDVVNRDQVSVGISGAFDDPISESCNVAVAALSAHLADRVGLRGNTYPALPNKKARFVSTHTESDSDTACPGAVAEDALPTITDRTVNILQSFAPMAAAAAASEPITPDTLVVGSPPRISRQDFAQILSEAESPAAPEAAAGWDAVAEYEVDPLFALAIFQFESDFGRQGVVAEHALNNPGHTRTSRNALGVTVDTPYGPFVRYPSWLDGWSDLAWRFVDPTFMYWQNAFRNVSDIMNVYAPASDSGDIMLPIREIVEFMNGHASAEVSALRLGAPCQSAADCSPTGGPVVCSGDAAASGRAKRCCRHAGACASSADCCGDLRCIAGVCTGSATTAACA